MRTISEDPGCHFNIHEYDISIKNRFYKYDFSRNVWYIFVESYFIYLSIL